jgi:hypothetical protein
MIAMALWAGTANASDVRIAGRVPVICIADHVSPAIPAHGNLGRVSAYCNAATGYTISVRHDGFLSAKTFLWEGRSIPVQSGGRTLLVKNSGPGVHQAELFIRGADEAEAAAAARVITVEIVES